VKKPLGEELSALSLGRSNTTSQGLFVLLGVTDAGFTGQIHTMIWTPSPPVSVPAGSRIAQLIPFKGQVPQAEQVEQGHGSFGSTGTPEISWVQQVHSARPILTCQVCNAGQQPKQINIKGMIDTGADVTIISTGRLPRKWATMQMHTGIAGTGGLSASQQSAQVVQVISPEGQVANVRPFVVNVPLSLWGQNILGSWGVIIGTNNSFAPF